MVSRELDIILVVQREADQEYEQVHAPLPNGPGVFFPVLVRLPI